MCIYVNVCVGVYKEAICLANMCLCEKREASVTCLILNLMPFQNPRTFHKINISVALVC